MMKTYFIRKWVASGTLLVLAACAAEPPAAPPPVANGSLPGAFEGPAIAGADVWPAPGWWRGFASPELNRLVTDAQEANLDLSAALARMRQAAAQVRIAGAPLLPSVNGDGSVRRSGTVDGSSGPTTGFGLGLGASYEVDFWGKNAAGLAGAEAALAASRYDRETVALSVTASVAATYLQLLSLRDRLRIARLNLDIAERVLDLVDARVENGAVSPLDLARQRAQVESQRAAIPALETQANEARVALALLLGRPSQAFDVAANSLASVAAPAVAPGLPSGLLARRPDIRKAEADLAAANANIAAARAAYFPEVNLSTTLASGAGSFSGLFQGMNIAYALGASIAQTIFDGGRREGVEEQALARREELVKRYQSAVIAAFGDVETALVELASRLRQETLKASELEQARIGFDLAEARYREGAEDLLSMLDAQRSLYQAEDQLGQIRLQRFQALIDLYSALGGGWQDTQTAATPAPG